MKTVATLIATLATIHSASADLSIDFTSEQVIGSQRQVTLTVSGIDSNHLYGVYRRDALVNTNEVLVSTNFIGITTSYAIMDSVAASNSMAFYRAKQEPGFIVWATPGAASGNSPGCPGPYVGYNIYLQEVPIFGWFQDTNNPPFIAMDAGGRTNTHIVALTRYGENFCGGSTLVMPKFFDDDGAFPAPAARFSIYFSNNLPTGPYPLRLIGFLPDF